MNESLFSLAVFHGSRYCTGKMQGEGVTGQESPSVPGPRPCLQAGECRWRSGRRTASLRGGRCLLRHDPFGIPLASAAPVKPSVPVNISLVPAPHYDLTGELSHSQVWSVKFLETNIYLNLINYRDDKAHLDMCFEETIELNFLNKKQGKPFLEN